MSLLPVWIPSPLLSLMKSSPNFLPRLALSSIPCPALFVATSRTLLVLLPHHQRLLHRPQRLPLYPVQSRSATSVVGETIPVLSAPESRTGVYVVPGTGIVTPPARIGTWSVSFVFLKVVLLLLLAIISMPILISILSLIFVLFRRIHNETDRDRRARIMTVVPRECFPEWNSESTKRSRFS